MKNKIHITTQSNLIHHGRAVILAAFLGLYVSHNACAQIVADFTGGNSSAVVDAWQGTGGSGWAGAWTIGVNSDLDLAAAATNTNPLTPSGGNYLGVTVTNNSSNLTRSGRVVRQYQNFGNVNLAETHTITFDYRLDMPQANSERLYLSGGSVSTSVPESDGASWIIRLNSTGSIRVFNGTTNTATGLNMVQNDTYRFTINVYPSSIAAESYYTVGIENLDTEDSYQSGSLLFFTPATSVGSHLNFTARMAPGIGNQTGFSLDSIHISAIPEASTLALLLSVFGALIMVKVLRAKNARTQN